MILEEFDFESEAVINPSDCVEPVPDIPKLAVTCFSYKTFGRMLEKVGGEQIAVTKNANGENPVYKTSYKGRDIAIFMSDMGASGAGADLDELYAMGVETVIMFGACGVLDRTIEDCSIIIPNSAVRDEGLSYHYAPPADEISVNPKYVTEFIELLKEVGCSYRVGKVWTTDAFYRETRAKVARRKEQGCICVDMECSAVTAVAQFRGKEIFQFFQAADNLDGEVWDKRSLSTNVKLEEKDWATWLALELAARI